MILILTIAGILCAWTILGSLARERKQAIEQLQQMHAAPKAAATQSGGKTGAAVGKIPTLR